MKKGNIYDYSIYNLTLHDDQIASLSNKLNQIHFRLNTLESLRNILTSDYKISTYPDYYIDGRLIFSDNSVIDFYSDGEIFILSRLNSNRDRHYIDNLEYEILNEEKMDEVINYIKTNGTPVEIN